MRESTVREYRISPDMIHFLKFVLEGYDGLAILTTLDAGEGRVILRCSAGSETEVDHLLAELTPLLSRRHDE